MTEQRDIELEHEWQRLLYRIKPKLKKKPTLQSLLFLIGLQEFGDVHRTYSKEEKQDLMHIAVCKVMSLSGYFKFIGHDEDGWPHYERTEQAQPEGLQEQEELLKKQILLYFEDL